MVHSFRLSRKLLVSMLIAALILVLVAIPAAAISPTNNAAPVSTKTPDPTDDTTTFHYEGVSVEFQNSNPCYGAASVKVTYDGVFHTTKNKNGTHVAYSVHGDYFVDPFAPNFPSYSGRFNESRSYQLDSNGMFLSKKFVTTVVADGKLFHITFHQRLNPLGGSLTVENFSCGM